MKQKFKPIILLVMVLTSMLFISCNEDETEVLIEQKDKMIISSSYVNKLDYEIKSVVNRSLVRLKQNKYQQRTGFDFSVN